MAVFNNDQNERKGSRSGGRGPTEVAQLSPNLEAAIWVSAGEDGSRRFHWSLSRVGEGDRRFKTLRVENLVELPEFIGKLAACFAEAADLPLDLREELASLAVTLQERVQPGRPHKPERGNGEDRSRVLAV